MGKRVLITGGAGYVGSHACKAFHSAGYEILVLDNLARGVRSAVKWGSFVQCDLKDAQRTELVVRDFKPDLVAHFAAMAYVGESVTDPALYYQNNVVGSANLLGAMIAASVDKLVFSSTCASYGVPQTVPIIELADRSPINPYGWTKLFTEQMLLDFAAAYDLSSVSLRYFNAAGADPEGELGECHEPETHALPLIIAAAEAQTPFTIYGTDFDTPDGSAVRDYVHVSDIADAHVRASEFLNGTQGAHAFNLGTGRGTSVYELIGSVEEFTGKRVPRRNGARRVGDPATLIADPRKANEMLSWHPTRSDLTTIVATASRWHQRHSDRM